MGGLGELKIEKYDLNENVSSNLTIGVSNVLYPELVPFDFYTCELIDL